MKDEAKKYRKVAKAIREAADAVDRVVDVIENESSTEAEIKKAMKNVAWKLMEMSVTMKMSPLT